MVGGGTEILLDVKKSQNMSGGKDESLINYPNSALGKE